MSEEQVVRNCAPTLAGLKTGNLFACPYENREDLLDFLRSLNRRLGKKGANFVTWEWDFDRNGVHMGHYFIEDYAGAKRDFAARSRLIEPQRLFSDKELGVIRNACEFALADDATLTYGDETRLRSIQEQIEILLPRNQEQEQEQEQRSEMEQTM